jgi:acetoin utilization protein AcuB
MEACVRLAQDNHVGCLPVIEDGRVVGILTTNDLFYVVMNPILGIGEGGSRIAVRHCANATEIGKAIQCVVEMGLDLTNAAYMPSRRGDEKDLFLHIAEGNPDKLVECMKAKGLDAEGRAR